MLHPCNNPVFEDTASFEGTGPFRQHPLPTLIPSTKGSTLESCCGTWVRTDSITVKPELVFSRGTERTQGAKRTQGAERTQEASQDITLPK